MKKIDAHAHIGYYGGFFDVGITAEELVRSMEDYKFEKSVISSMENEKTKEAVEEYPDSLIGAVWVDPKEGDAAVEEVYDYVEGQQFKGIKLHPLMQSYVADAEIVHPIARAAGDLEAPLFVHSGHPPFSLPWSIAQLAEKFPEVNVVMVHMGHGHGVYIKAALDMAERYENVYLETSGMPMHTKIKEAFDRVGSDRVIFGTDIPFHHPTVEVQKCKVSGLTDEQLKKLFYLNVKKLLDL